MLVDISLIVIVVYFGYFRTKYKENNILVILLFLSYMIFATNFIDYGFDFHIYRLIHKSIGVLVVLSALYYIYKNGINSINNIIIGFLIVFLIIILLSLIGNDIYMTHYKHYVINFIFSSSIITFLIFRMDSNNKFDELCKFIVHITLILSVFSIVEMIINSARTNLMYSNPNYLGYTLFLGFIITLFTKQKYKVLKIIIFTIAIFTTGSRAVEVPIVIILCVYIIKNYNNFNKKYFFALILSSVILFGLFWEKIIINKGSSNVRSELAYIGFKALKESPINGMGYFQFRTNFKNYIDENITNKEILTTEEIMTHNDFVKIYSELGLLGIGFIIFYFYKLYFELKRLVLYSQDYFFLAISLILGSSFFSLFHNNITSFIFWFILFLPFIMNRIFESTKLETK